MAISVPRAEELLKNFETVKKSIDDIDRKYSLDYVQPLLDMPDSLNLPRMEYVPKSEEELLQSATQQTEAAYLSSLNRLQSSNFSKNLALDKRLDDLAEQTRVKVAQLLTKLNDEIESVNTKITNAGMMFSSVAERVKMRLRRDYEGQIEQANLSADNERTAIEAEKQSVNSDFQREQETLLAQRQAQITQAYEKLAESERKEQISVDKYNNTLDEKETKYRMSYAKALESARQAEYDRAYKAKKLYQELGATGYEQSILWEKYNVFTSYFSSFTKREEALFLIQGDSYVKGHLKEYYSTLVDWVNRNVPA